MKYKLILIFVFSVSLLLSTGCGLLPTEDERLNPPIKEAKEIEYKTIPVVRMDLEKQLTLFAQWKAANKVLYSFSEFNAPFLEFKVSLGDVVKPGDVLAVLNIGNIDKSLRDMEIAYQKQKLSFERTKERYNAGLLSEYDLKLAELDFQDITNHYDDLKEEKAGSLLISNIDGTVLYLLDIEPGEMVNTGTNIVTLVKNDDIILQGSSSQVRTSTVKIGDYVKLEGRDETIGGTISDIQGTLVTIQPERMLDTWELGSTVKADIPISSSQGTLVIDIQALKSLGGTYYVRVLVDGIAIEKNVTLGISSGRSVEILTGLSEGDLVIIN